MPFSGFSAGVISTIGVNIVVGPITFDANVVKSGNTYTFTARRIANIANAETRQAAIGASLTYSPASIASDLTSAVNVPINFAAGLATATVSVTAPSAIPE